ncbi:MAG: hypothetical protein LBR39_08455 [Coriobacteriales bacterium]|jgi:Tfp pilus assembly protein PilE|nr:hypothetical protein [Coriobacteriales bacterium]
MATASKSRALFLELVLNLLVFAICAVVCIQVFSTAKVASEQSAAYSALSAEAQSQISAFKANTEGYSPQTLYFDQEFAPVSEAAAVYTLRCETGSDSGLATISLTALMREQELFSLTATEDASQRINTTAKGVEHA